MRSSIIILTFITIFSCFAGGGKLQEFTQCKNEMKELRKAHAFEVAYGGDYFLNSEFFRGLSRIPDIIYFGQKTFNFRPWLKEINLEKKLRACKDVREELRGAFGEPTGFDSISRRAVEDVENSSNHDFLYHSVGVSPR